MALEKFIRGKVDSANHAGLYSTRRRLDSAMAQIKSWRNQREEAHSGGHKEPAGNSLCYDGETDGHFQVAEIDKIPQDQEIVLFELPK